MLVLSRKVNESIWIGDDIEVYVTKINGGQVYLGVTAPRHVPIHRHEVRDAMQQLAVDAASNNADDKETPE